MRKTTFLRARSVRTSAALALVLAAARPMSPLLRAAGPAAGEHTEQEEPNPAYLGWATFQPGAWVAKKYAGTPEAEIKEVLKSVTSAEAVVDVHRSLPGIGPLPTQTLRIPARRKARPAEAAVKTSEEILTINGKQVRCRVERGPALALWETSEIPGGLARLEAIVGGSWVIAWGEKPE